MSKFKSLILKVNPETHRAFKTACSSQGTNMSQKIGEWIDAFINEPPPQKAGTLPINAAIRRQVWQVLKAAAAHEQVDLPEAVYQELPKINRQVVRAIHREYIVYAIETGLYNEGGGGNGKND